MNPTIVKITTRKTLYYGKHPADPNIQRTTYRMRGIDETGQKWSFSVHLDAWTGENGEHHQLQSAYFAFKKEK